MKKLQHFVEEHHADIFKLGPVDDHDISAAEARLGHSIPKQLREYIRLYGALSFGSVEFYGLGMKPTSHLNLVHRTLDLRTEVGFPSSSVVLEDLGDGHYAVCKTDGTVLEWAFPTYVGDSRELARSPEVYMMKRLLEA